MVEFSDDPLSMYYLRRAHDTRKLSLPSVPEMPGKEPLPAHVLQALKTIETYCISVSINWTSRRDEQRRQALSSLKVLVGALDALSCAEYFELREKAQKQERKAS